MRPIGPRITTSVGCHSEAPNAAETRTHPGPVHSVQKRLRSQRVPTKSRTEAGQRIAYLRWLWWETVRRHPDYRYDVDRLLRSLRRELAGQRRRTGAPIVGRSFTPPGDPDTIARAHPEPSISSAPAPTVDPPDPEPSLLFDSPTTIRSLNPMLRRVQAVHDALNLYRITWTLARREPTADVSVVYLVRSRIELPELATFEAKWGLKYPVPPRAERVPERLMSAPITHPVRIVSDDPPNLVLEIWQPAGRTALDHVAGILDQYQEHREEVLPPRWSLQQIDKAVRQQFGPSPDPEDADEITEYQNWLAREAGYPSYVNLQHQMRQLDQQSAAEGEEASTIEETAAMNMLRKPGIPPRQARKGGVLGEISLQDQPEGWLRLTLTRPEAVDFGTLTTMLKAHLTRGSLTVRVEAAHCRVLAVQDLLRKKRPAPQIAEKLGLYDSTSWGPDRVIELKRAYQDLVRRLHLPPLPSTR
jgi:hypothetical protein